MRRAAARRRGIMMGAAADPLAAAILALNPYKYVRLGEASGVIAVDEQGNGNGTYINTPTLGVAGVPGAGGNTAVDFTLANSERVDFAYDAALQGNAAFSIFAAIKMTGAVTAARTIAGVFNSGTPSQRAWLLSIRGASPYNLAFIVKDGTGTIVRAEAAQSLVNDGAFHTIGGSHEGGTVNQLRLLVDGNEEDLQTTSGAALAIATTEPLYIGYNGGGAYWDDTIDEVAIWDSTRITGAQFADLHTASGI